MSHQATGFLETFASPLITRRILSRGESWRTRGMVLYKTPLACVEGGLSRADSLSYDGSCMDIGLCLTGWQVYEVSGIETFASPYIRRKPSQALARLKLVESSVYHVLAGFGITW